MSKATRDRVARRIAAKVRDVKLDVAESQAKVGEVFGIRPETALRFGYQAQVVARLRGELAAAEKAANAATAAIQAEASEGGKFLIVAVDVESYTVTRKLNPDFVPKQDKQE